MLNFPAIPPARRGIDLAGRGGWIDAAAPAPESFAALARSDVPIASVTIVTEAERARQADAIVAATRRAIDASGAMRALRAGPRNVLAAMLDNADAAQTRKFGVAVVTVRPGELARHCGASRRSFFRHLARLIGGGIVTPIGNGRAHNCYRVSVPDLAPMPISVPDLAPMPAARQYLSLDDDDDRLGAQTADEPAFAILTGAGLPADVAAVELRERRAAGRPVDAADAGEMVKRTRRKRPGNPIGYMVTLIRNGIFPQAELFDTPRPTGKQSAAAPAGGVRGMSGPEHDAAKRAQRDAQDKAQIRAEWADCGRVIGELRDAGKLPGEIAAVLAELDAAGNDFMAGRVRRQRDAGKIGPDLAALIAGRQKRAGPGAGPGGA